MPQFRSKPRQITANQWHVDQEQLVPGECRGGEDCESGPYDVFRRTHVHTLHGQPMFLADGDWIVPEPDSVHFYLIKDDVMKTNYEEITDANT